MQSTNIKNMLSILGYSEEHFSQNYSVQIDGTSAIKFDYVAFSDRYLKDISTSCIAVQEIHDDREEKRYLEGAKYLATPIMLVSKGNHVRVWNITPQKATLLEEKEENIIQLYFERNRFEFMSDYLIEAKMGFRQLNIFEVAGLIDFSRNATCKILSEEFENGLRAAKRYLSSKKKINGRDLNNITSITMHIISALIINSKIKTDENILDIFELLEELSQTYKSYFDEKLMLKYGKELLEEIYESLNKSINYQSVDHELLGYFYESTLLQLNEKKAENIRKEFGIYYTPKILSQEIAESIPFENIPVDQRYVLDGTCGSGSLLLSACKRLEELVSYEKTEFERHNYLTTMIEGYDIDKFASEVARLSLLLYSLPYGNQWSIKAGDLLRMKRPMGDFPYVIMGNPPYEETRGESKKSQKATEFFDKYLEWLHEDGYIGIILPESFLQNDSSIEQRRILLEKFDILELWTLPGQIFENNCSTIVIIAQKKEVPSDNLTKIKMLVRNKNSIDNYFKQHKWDFEFFVNKQKEWGKERKYKISISPVDEILGKIMTGRKTLGTITENVMGIMLPSKYQFSKMRFDDWVSYIPNAVGFQKYVMSERMCDNTQYFNYEMTEEEEKEIKADYKGLRLRKKYKNLYAKKGKILVKMSSTPGEINCVSALIDEKGYYPCHSFLVMDAKETGFSNYVLCALINSKLINAYVRKECVKRTLTTSVVRSIPVPEFTDIQVSELEQCYFDIKEAYESDEHEMIGEIQEKIDNIIFEAFELNEIESAKIRKLYDIYIGNSCRDDEKSDNGESYDTVSGLVEKIDITEMICDVYMAEFGAKKLEIQCSMPGWFLREGAEFSAKYQEGKLFDIKPLVYSYLNDDELIERLSDEFVS